MRELFADSNKETSLAEGDEGAGETKAIQENIHLVQRELDRLQRRIPFSIERDDLRGAGLIGLWEAVKRHEPLLFDENGLNYVNHI